MIEVPAYPVYKSVVDWKKFDELGPTAKLLETCEMLGRCILRQPKDGGVFWYLCAARTILERALDWTLKNELSNPKGKEGE